MLVELDIRVLLCLGPAQAGDNRALASYSLRGREFFSRFASNTLLAFFPSRRCSALPLEHRSDKTVVSKRLV